MKFALWKYPIHAIAYGLYSGKLTKAPGTMGSLLAVPLYIFLSSYQPTQYLSMVIALYITGIFICHQTAKDNNAVDPGYIVFDEIVGFLVAMYMVPVTWYWIVIGFIIFRGFDILKPPPIKAVEKSFSLGAAIMFDDVIAGLYTLCILHSLIFIVS